jgi:hypothetical protein
MESVPEISYTLPIEFEILLILLGFGLTYLLNRYYDLPYLSISSNKKKINYIKASLFFYSTLTITGNSLYQLYSLLWTSFIIVQINSQIHQEGCIFINPVIPDEVIKNATQNWPIIINSQVCEVTACDIHYANPFFVPAPFLFLIFSLYLNYKKLKCPDDKIFIILFELLTFGFIPLSMAWTLTQWDSCYSFLNIYLENGSSNPGMVNSYVYFMTTYGISFFVVLCVLSLAAACYKFCRNDDSFSLSFCLLICLLLILGLLNRVLYIMQVFHRVFPYFISLRDLIFHHDDWQSCIPCFQKDSSTTGYLNIRNMKK